MSAAHGEPATIRDGEVFLLRTFKSWPVHDVFCERLPADDSHTSIYLTWWPDGGLGIDVRARDDSLIATGRTQSLHIIGTGLFVLAVTWTGGAARVQINDRDVGSWETSADVLIIEAGATGDGACAIDHVDARSVCAAKMSRRSTYLVPKTTGPNHRLVTLEEDQTRLRKELRAAREYAGAIRKGADHHVPALRNCMRGLVYWRFTNGKPRNNHQPLLLRVAARLDRPLPIFAFPTDRDPPEILSSAHSNLNLNIIGVVRAFPKQILMDVEDWLDGSVYVRRGAIMHESTAGKLLADIAQKLGGSHADPEIPLWLEDLDIGRFSDGPLLTVFLLDLSEVVCALGDSILRA